MIHIWSYWKLLEQIIELVVVKLRKSKVKVFVVNLGVHVDYILLIVAVYTNTACCNINK